VYVRHIKGMPHEESAKDFIDWDASTSQLVPGARQRLHGLEAQLRRQLGDHVHDLHTTWSRHGRNGAVNKAYLKRFCDEFLIHQKALIDAELAILERTDERQLREQAHQHFGAERARVFAGRKALLERISRYTETVLPDRGPRLAKKRAPAAPLILLGGGGSGKSAVLARAAKESIQKSKRSGAIVLQRYIGGVPGTESLMTTLTTLTADIASLYGQPEPLTPENAKALSENFQEALRLANSRRPLILYLDALDQLDKADSAWMLEWLPKELPEYVRVVTSVRTDTNVDRSARKRYPKNRIEVQAMNPAEGRAMLSAWLADKRTAWFNAGIAPSTGRLLTLQQEQAVLVAFNARGNGSALWLKLAYEEAASWASWDAPRQLPNTISGMIEDLIDRRLLKHENHPKAFTERAMAYLAAGRFGLSESELGRALGTDKAVRAEFQANEKTQKRWEDDERLPPILWSRLFFDLQPYLGLAQVDGALLMRWFHREFGEVLKARYLASDEDRMTIHGALADTFLELERELRPEETNDDSLFRATDASGKQVSAALRRVMEQPWQLGQAGMQKELQMLLTNFGFSMGKCAANRTIDFVAELTACRTTCFENARFGTWQEFLLEQSYILRRGDQRWPAHKILLQIAVEHADDSPITMEADKWLNDGHCDWVWLRKRNRPRNLSQSPLLLVMEGHSKAVNGARFLEDGRVLSWSQDGTVGLWDGSSGIPLEILRGHTHGINIVKILPDGRVLSCSYDGAIRCWDTYSGALVSFMDGHKERINGISILSGGSLVSWSDDCTLRLWNLESGATLKVLRGHAEAITGVEVGPNCTILSWSLDKTLRLWSSMTGELLAILSGHTGRINGAQFLSDGVVISWSEDGTIRHWDAQSGTPSVVLEHHEAGEWAPIWGVGVLPNNQLLSWTGAGTGGGALYLWSATDEFPVVMEGHESSIRGAEVLSDGRALTWSDDKTLRIWDMKSGQTLALLRGHTDLVWGRWLSDQRVLSWSYDKTLRLWDCATGRTLAVLEGHSGRVLGARVLPNQVCLSWSSDNTLRLWDGLSGSLLAVMQGHTKPIQNVDVSADGRILSWSQDGSLRVWNGLALPSPHPAEKIAAEFLSAKFVSKRRLVSWGSFVSDDFKLRLWDSDTGALLAVLDGHKGVIEDVELLANDQILSWSNDGSLRLWDGNSGAPLTLMEGHSEGINGIEILSDQRILSWSWDGTLRVWNSQTGLQLAAMESQAMLEGGRACPGCVGARSLPDGRVLSWFSDDTIRLWNGRTGGLLAAMRGHSGSVLDAQLLLNGAVVSYCDGRFTQDYALRLWDSQSGTCIAVMDGHKKPIVGIRVFPDSRVLSWSDDHTLRLWDGNNGALLAVMEGHTDTIFIAEEMSQDQILSWSSDGSLRLWDGINGALLTVMKAHTNGISGIATSLQGQIFAWDWDDKVHLWDVSNGICLKTFTQPWIESTPLPELGDSVDRVAGATRFGNCWVQIINEGLVLVNIEDGWKAYWHGPSEEVVGSTTDSFVCQVDRELYWLIVIDGCDVLALN